MNINNFKGFIEKTILSRGYNYYIDGNIAEAYDQGDNEYFFLVEGSEDYEVMVKLDSKGEIIYSDCDCPYDFGPICKHQVAAYYKLSEMLNNSDCKLTEKKALQKQMGIKEVLENLSKEELIKILLEQTRRDTTLKSSLILKYSKGDIEGELKKCKRYMEAIIKKYTDRDGFIPYRDTCDFSLEMQEVLEKARETKNILLSLDIAFLLLKEAVEAYQYSDDSDGYIGSLVTETIEFIREIVIDSEALSTDIREKIFNKMLTESDSRVFEGWDDYRIDLLRLCIEFTDIEELRNKLKMKINSNIDKNSGDKYGEYYVEGLKQILFELVNDFGTQEDTEEFIKENLKYSSFREMLIGKLIIEGKFQEVVVVAYEGEVKDKDYAGLVSKWRKMRYEAYKRLGLVEEQANLAKELFFDGDFEYYQELKELTKEDKKVFYNNLKLELKNSKDWHVRRIYLKLITEEKDLDAILEHAKGNTSSIEEYAEMLQEKYKDEVIEIYEKHIKASADAASNRSAYKRVCGILRGYKKIAGVDNQVNLINQLMALHKKRPAFIDELSKIK